MEEARTLKDRQAERKGQSLLGSEGGLSKAMGKRSAMTGAQRPSWSLQWKYVEMRVKVRQVG